jgi:hypothetical protein
MYLCEEQRNPDFLIKQRMGVCVALQRAFAGLGVATQHPKQRKQRQSGRLGRVLLTSLQNLINVENRLFHSVVEAHQKRVTSDL